MKALGFFIKGMCIGAADVVPGVSGGTMALILGIYPRLIAAIRSFDALFLCHLARLRLGQAKARLDLALLLPLGAGIFAAWLFFTRIVPLQELVKTHTVFVHGLFFGLIATSAIMLLRSQGSLRLREWGLLAASVGICAAGLWLAPTESALSALSAAPTPWLIALSGSLAASAMLLPGISGAFILLVSGQYAIVLDGFARFDPAILLPFGLGAGLGLAVFSRVIAWLLHRRERPTILVLVGLMIGALPALWPFFDASGPSLESTDAGAAPSSAPMGSSSTDDLIATVALMIIGAGLVLVLNALSRKSRP